MTARKRLLLADDSRTIHRVIELTFADEPFDLVCVLDGQAAVAALRAQPPDVVLADVSMPTPDGYDLCAFIKHAPELAHIPVALLTGAFEPVLEERAVAARCDSVVSKPFEPHALVALVWRLLQGVEPAWQPRRALPQAPDAVPPSLSGSAAVEAAAAAPAAHEGDAELFERLDREFTAAGLASSAHGSRAVDGADPGTPPGPPAPARAPFGLADAFRAVLALEAGTAVAPAPGSGVPALWSPALLDDLTARVAERLTDRLTRDAIERHVASVAERIVREEVARLGPRP